jgi:formylglycine-generating enzyme required for sulfatase activity
MTSTASKPDILNPFPGLRCFQTDEDYLFFGRHEQVEDLLRRLRTNRLVAVVGTSGSGKSSLVRAGLLPAVLGGGMAQAGSAWEVAVMRPGGSPLAHLARALCEAGLYDADAEDVLFHLQATLSRSRNGLVEAVRQSRPAARSQEPGSKLLLVVDQFEELFRFHRAGVTSQEEAIGFVNLLLHATERADHSVFVVLTMRSDFLGECSQFLGLAEAVNDGEFLIPRMTRDQVQEAIEGPIRVRGAAIAPRLLFRLLNDVQDSQDQLPVLQHALMRTWELWQRSGPSDGAALDLAHYEATGGMHEALSQHADEVFAALPSEGHRVAADCIFKALTERGPDGRGIRRPTRLSQLEAIAAVDGPIVHQVIEAYRVPGVTFLMPPAPSALGEATVIDVSHESLMRVWRRLRGWVEEEAQSARIYRRLHETAVLHAENRAGLYHDPDLQIAQTWREANGPNAAWADQYGGGFAQAMAFLDESREAAERAQQDREATQRQELERARQLAEAQAGLARVFKRFAGGLAAVLCLVVAVTIWALVLRQEAIRQEHEAIRQGAEADKQRQIAEEEELKTKALELVQLVLTVDTPNVASHIAQISSHRILADSMLHEVYDEAPPNSSRKLHASLALLPVDPRQVDYLYGRLLEADARDLPVIRDALTPHKNGLLDKLWKVIQKPENGRASQRLRAAAALAKYDPDGEGWGASLQVEAVVFLSNLQEKNVQVLGNHFRKDGFIDCPRLIPIVVDDARFPHSLFTHPAAQTFASVSYDLDRPYTQFLAKVGIPSLVPEQQDPQAPLTFEVLGDGMPLWKSVPLAKQGDVQNCEIRLADIKQLELRVNIAGPSDWAHPVWLEPRLTTDHSAPVTDSVVNELMAVPAADLALWADALRPVRLKLLAPLSVIYRSIDRSQERWSRAFDILAEYAHDQPPWPAELLMDAREEQFAMLFGKLSAGGDQSVPALVGEINRALPPDATEEAQDELAKRQANAAVALLRMNHSSPCWALLKQSPDPRLRSYLIQRLSPLGADAETILKQFDSESDPSILAALVLSLGEFGEKDFTHDDRQALIPKLRESYTTAANPALHSAAEWLLRQQKDEAWLNAANQSWADDQRQQSARLEETEQELKQGSGDAQARWYVNGQGQTLVVIPGPVEFWMGSPTAEVGRADGPAGKEELRHWRRIGRAFALATKEVTVQQFLRFRKDHAVSRQHAPSDDCPVNMVSWYEAAEYCNWLSEQEGIPPDQWCYEPNSAGRYADGMKMAADYSQRTGYRLPTEAEWEFTCRAGAVTRFSFGESEELLARYAWYQANGESKSWPVGSLRPNDFGMFDMHGNDWEWCQNPYKPYGAGEDGKAIADPDDTLAITDGEARVQRGGSTFNDPAALVRSACRNPWKNGPTFRQGNTGFRPARSLPLSSLDRSAAARAAALAAGRQNRVQPPLDDAAKTKFHRQALDWLKAELAFWSKAKPPRSFMARKVWSWQYDSALAGIRDQAALAKLPPEVHRAFTEFWADVANLAEPSNSSERLEFARVAMLASGHSTDEPPLDDRAKANLRRQALEWLTTELTAATDNARTAKIIAVASLFEGALAKLAESAPNVGKFQAELARYHEVRGNHRLADAATAKARTLLETQLAKEPENLALATDLADVLLIDTRWTVLRPAELTSQGGATLTRLDDNSILAGGTNPDRDVYSLIAKTDQEQITAIRLEALPDPSLPANGPGRAPGGANAGNFHLNKLRLFSGGRPCPLTNIIVVHANVLNGAPSQFRTVIDGDLDDRPGWGNYPRAGEPNTAAIATRVAHNTGEELKFEMYFSRSNWTQHNLGRFRLSVSGDPTIFEREEIRYSALRDTNPWSKLAAAYALVGRDDKAVEYLAKALRWADDRAGKAKVIAAAVPLPGMLEKLAESIPDDAELQARLAQYFGERGNHPKAGAARSKARALFEVHLAQKPDNSELAAELAQLLLDEPGPAEPEWVVLQPAETQTESGAKLTPQDDGSILVEAAPETQTQTVRFRGGPHGVRAVRIETSSRASVATIGAPFFNEYVAVAADIDASPPGVLQGQFVRLDLPGDHRQFPRHPDDQDRKSINLAELQVFQRDRNIALRKPARQSADFPGGGSRLAPQNAVDGNTVGNDQNNPYAHTAIENDPWWEVDLGSVEPIDRIVIWNRIEAGRYAGLFQRMNHFRIRVLDRSRNVVFEQVVDPAPNPSTEIVLQAVLRESKAEAPGEDSPLLVRLPSNTPSDAPTRYRVSVATRLANVGADEKRLAVEKLTDPRLRLVATYMLIGRNDKGWEYLDKALEADPKLGDDREAQYRYQAARWAVLAVAGQGLDGPPLGDGAKVKLRSRALNWLSAELAAWGRFLESSKFLESSPPQNRLLIVLSLISWQNDSDLATIRDAADLAKLPEAEQQAFTQLWTDVAALATKAEESADNAERLAAAQIAHVRRQFATSAREFAKALTADPKLADGREEQHRYNAACAAALAAARQGLNEPLPDDGAKAKLRGQALDWLTAELRVWDNLFAAGAPQDRPLILRILNHWQRDADLAGIRDPAQLDKLPADERKAFAQLWADVAALLKKVEATVPRAVPAFGVRAGGG